MKYFWHALLWLNWGIIFLFWWQNSGALFGQGAAGILIALGRIAGLAAAYFILIQFFFMGRLPWLERVFGLDRLSRIHHTSGQWGILLLVLHPILLVFGYKIPAGVSAWQQFLDFLFNSEDVSTGLLGLVLFLLVVGASIAIVRSRLRYESWYVVHLAAYVAVFSAFGHQLGLGGDFLASRLFYGYWIVLYTAVFASHAVFRVLRPLLLLQRHRFTVSRIVRESPSAVSLYLSGRDLDRFLVRPGQFMIFRFFSKGFWLQAHPFSLSMLPDGKELRITVKEVGDFTKGVKDIPPGTMVLVDGPYGIFTDLFSASSKMLLVAGGIGITPVRCLMEDLLQKGKDVVLLYSNKFKGDIIFEHELETLRERYPARIIQVLSGEPEYEGEKGRIDRDKLQRLVPDLASRDIYMCGPVPMMDTLLAVFRTFGIPDGRIHYEKFSL